MRSASLAMLVLFALLAPTASAISLYPCQDIGATGRACQVVRDRPDSIPLPAVPSGPLPSVPGAPSVPPVPGAPAIPAVPSGPGLPDVPTPGLPGVPTPGLPATPSPPPVDPADGCSAAPQQLPVGLSRQELLRTFADPRAFCRETV